MPAFVSLGQIRVPQEEVTSMEKWPPSDWPVSVIMGHLPDCSLRAQPTVSAAVPGQEGLGCVSG